MLLRICQGCKWLRSKHLGFNSAKTTCWDETELGENASRPGFYSDSEFGPPGVHVDN